MFSMCTFTETPCIFRSLPRNGNVALFIFPATLLTSTFCVQNIWALPPSNVHLVRGKFYPGEKHNTEKERETENEVGNELPVSVSTEPWLITNSPLPQTLIFVDISEIFTIHSVRVLPKLMRCLLCLEGEGGGTLKPAHLAVGPTVQKSYVHRKCMKENECLLYSLSLRLCYVNSRMYYFSLIRWLTAISFSFFRKCPSTLHTTTTTTVPLYTKQRREKSDVEKWD